jgi:signal transduction histidine kinase
MPGTRVIESVAEAIVDTVREPLILLDAEQRVLKVNRAFCRAFAATPEGSVGRLLGELNGGAWNSPPLHDLLEGVSLRDESFEDFELAHDFPGVGPRVLILNARRLVRGGDVRHTVLLALEDVTERRKAEALVREHTEALTRSNRDLEEFAYVASHDLQEPLRMVVSYTQLLAKRYKGKLDQDADEFIGFAVDGAKRMQRLINDLLTYSRLGSKDVPVEPASSAEALADALRALNTAVVDSGAIVEAGALPLVRANRVQMVQLFQNLIGNSLKFRSAAAPMIRVSAERDGAYWSFRVADNGIGIDARHFDKVFIIFERLHGVEIPGTGIGLALCRKIVQSLGGRIWIEPGRTGGTTFRFTLPSTGDDPS